MKKGWEVKKLGDLFDITSSKRVFESEWKREGVPFYRAREIVKLARQGFVENELFISEEMFKRYSSKYGIPKGGDIMVTGVGTLGICYVVQKADRFYFKDGNIIWLKKKSEADSRFVEYAFKSDFLRKQIDDTVGATVGTFTIIKAINTLIPVPSLTEQQRIVRILDEAFEVIATAKANAEKNLQNTRAVFESYLEAVFSQRGEEWEETTVEKLSTNLDSKRVPITKSDRKSGKYPYYGASGIVDYVGDFIFEGDTLLVSEDGANLLARSTPIAFSVSGKYWVNNHAHILKFENMATQRFVEFYLTSITLDEYIRGAAQPKLTQKALNSIPIPIPKLVDGQAMIVKRIESLRDETKRLESIYRRKLDALEELKKSLLHRAFNGEL